jgi:hypothetical protein
MNSTNIHVIVSNQCNQDCLGPLKMFTQIFILQHLNAHIVTLNDHKTKHEIETSNGE